MEGSVDDRTVREVVEGLRALLEAIDAGRVEATAVQRAYLAGRWTRSTSSQNVRSETVLYVIFPAGLRPVAPSHKSVSKLVSRW